MKDKQEYSKFADDAVRGRASEEGFGRLRMAVFWAAIGPLALFGTHMIEFTLKKWMAMAVVATAPLAILLLIINYIRLPGDSKASGAALMIALMTIAGAAATLVLSSMWGVFQIAGS